MIVEIIYLANETQNFKQSLSLDKPSSAEQALKSSEIFKSHPELLIDSLELGVFSKKINLDCLLKDGDRIEIYRPLTISPMEKRRLLASKK